MAAAVGERAAVADERPLFVAEVSVAQREGVGAGIEARVDRKLFRRALSDGFRRGRRAAVDAGVVGAMNGE
jgi:hypothetical protein